MSEERPTPLNDELLSAYIDGELSDDELRAVEAHLAEDAAAQATVDELRSVSAAVRSLPEQSVPAGWRERLASRLDGATAQDQSTPDALPSLPVGRTARGWWWSAGAIAAAVAIMLLVPDEPANQVAQAPVEERAADEAEAADDSAAVPELFARDDGAAEPPEPSSEALGRESEAPPARAEATAPAEAPAGREMTRADLGFAAMDGLDTHNGYLIVWADVLPQVVHEKQIDRLLVTNGIPVDQRTDAWHAAAEPVRQQLAIRNAAQLGQTVDAAEADDAADSAPDRMRLSTNNLSRESATESQLDVPQQDADSEEEVEGEAILVEATAEQIADCLADMQSDPRNYLNLTVEPVRQAELGQQFGAIPSIGPAPPPETATRGVAGGRAASGEPVMELREQSVAGEVATADTAATASPRARRLKQPTTTWSYFAHPPQDAGQTYNLRVAGQPPTSEGAPLAVKANEPQQRAELRRWVAQQASEPPADNRGGAASAEPQRMQVLLMLRCSDSSTESQGAPAAEAPTEAP